MRYNLTKTEVCERFINEADKMIKALTELKNYCDRVIILDELSDTGRYRGDGANDPENIVNNSMRRPNDFIDSTVKPKWDDMVSNNKFIIPYLDACKLLKDILVAVDEGQISEEVYRVFHHEDTEKCQCKNCEMYDCCKGKEKEKQQTATNENHTIEEEDNEYSIFDILNMFLSI